MTVYSGSTYSQLKAAVTEQLEARADLGGAGVRVSYQAPVQPTDTEGVLGTYEAIWLDDVPTGEHENRVICSVPLQLEELYSLRLTIQVLKPDSEGTQEAADRRVDELLYGVLSELAHDPTWGLTAHENFVYVHTTLTAFERKTGYLPNGAGHGASWEGQLQVEARLSFPE